MRRAFCGPASSGTPLIAPALMSPLRSAEWIATLIVVSVTPVSDAKFLTVVAAPPAVVPELAAVVVVAVELELSPHAAAMSAAEIRLTKRSLYCRFTLGIPLLCECHPSIRRDGGRRLACAGRHM